MRAVVFEEYQTFPSLKEVEKPTPGPGEVLLKVAGSGACHSDVAIYNDFTPDFGPPQMAPSFILGHENSGWVEELGQAVTGITKGDAYLGSGLGRDGGMAEYLAVPARSLVALGDVDPIAAAPLSDAGLTPYMKDSAMRRAGELDGRAVVVPHGS